MKLKSLRKNVLKSLVIVIVLAILGGGLMGFHAKRSQTTTYTTKTNIIVSHDLNNVSNENTNDGQTIVNADLNMMPTYEDIAKNITISKQAKKYLPLKVRKEYSLDDINNAVNAKTRPQSLVLTMEATTKSKYDSVEIANSSAKAFIKELPKVQTGVNNVRIIDKATKLNTTSKTSPSVKKYVAVGIALGGLIGLIISFMFITSKEFNSTRK